MLRVRIQVRFTDDDTVIADDEILTLDRGDDHLETIGLSLDEAKTLLTRLQERVVVAQAARYVDRHRHCAACGRRLPSKGRKAQPCEKAR